MLGGGVLEQLQGSVLTQLRGIICALVVSVTVKFELQSLWVIQLLLTDNLPGNSRRVSGTRPCDRNSKVQLGL